MTPRIVIAATAMLVLLAACAERDQSASTVNKGGAPSWQGGADPYAAAGWKAGDEATWNEQIQRRAQAQNEYVRIGDAR